MNLKKRWSFRKIKRMGRSDLTVGMIRVIALCWLLPYLLISISLLYSSNIKNDEQVKDTINTSMKNAAEICKTSIDNAIYESKQASYDGIIKKSYEQFLKDNDESTMYKKIRSYLNSTYGYSSVISNTILLFSEKMDMEYYTYSNIAGSTYSNIEEFKRNAAVAVKYGARDLGTTTTLVTVSGHLYIVRNIVTSNYRPFTTLVMEVNTDQIFKNYENVVWTKGDIVYIDSEIAQVSDNLSEENQNTLEQYAGQILNGEQFNSSEVKSDYNKSESAAYLSMMVNGQKMTVVFKLDKAAIFQEKHTFTFVYIAIFVLLIPLLLATFNYFYSNISRPIKNLVSASGKIENGEYGYEVEPFDKNREIGKLVDTFNHMSVSLEDSFNKIYAEEVVARDAKLEALQSQINPHFLNNTLEIINWKARMSGNEDVSEMISSLSVMMGATMNRNNENFITLREELEYVDAYLYIIVQRFGNKFFFEKDIDETLLDTKIPRLIIQPLVENAVEHGGDKYGNKTGKLQITGDDKYLYIIVENNGNISVKDQQKIEELLSSDNLTEKRTNIGIRNVHARLKLLYGNDSGLTIENIAENKTVSRIVIDREKLNKEEKENA